MHQQSENGGQGVEQGKVSGGLAECAGPARDYRGLKNLKNWKMFGKRLGLEFVCAPPRRGRRIGSLTRMAPDQGFRMMGCGFAGLLFVDLLWFLASCFGSGLDSFTGQKSVRWH